MKSWCERGDPPPHGFTRQILSSTRTKNQGEEGLRLGREKRPDVIVLDMLLPKPGSLDVLQSLKDDPATTGIPVITLSGLPMTNEAQLRRDGAVKYLQKSVFEDLDHLRALTYHGKNSRNAGE
jgi:CheY-like chemotaxis protein